MANVETPGYRPQDVSFDTYLVKAGDSLQATHPEHMGVLGEMSTAMELFEDTSVAPGLNGNSVSMEREMAKIAANSIRYQAVAEMISRKLAGLKYAASDGQGSV